MQFTLSGYALFLSVFPSQDQYWLSRPLLNFVTTIFEGEMTSITCPFHWVLIEKWPVKIMVCLIQFLVINQNYIWQSTHPFGFLGTICFCTFHHMEYYPILQSRRECDGVIYQHFSMILLAHASMELKLNYMNLLDLLCRHQLLSPILLQ